MEVLTQRFVKKSELFKDCAELLYEFGKSAGMPYAFGATHLLVPSGSIFRWLNQHLTVWRTQHDLVLSRLRSFNDLMVDLNS